MAGAEGSNSVENIEKWLIDSVESEQDDDFKGNFDENELLVSPVFNDSMNSSGGFEGDFSFNESSEGAFGVFEFEPNHSIVGSSISNQESFSSLARSPRRQITKNVFVGFDVIEETSSLSTIRQRNTTSSSMEEQSANIRSPSRHAVTLEDPLTAANLQQEPLRPPSRHSTLEKSLYGDEFQDEDLMTMRRSPTRSLSVKHTFLQSEAQALHMRMSSVEITDDASFGLHQSGQVRRSPTRSYSNNSHFDSGLRQLDLPFVADVSLEDMQQRQMHHQIQQQMLQQQMQQQQRQIQQHQLQQHMQQQNRLQQMQQQVQHQQMQSMQPLHMQNMLHQQQLQVQGIQPQGMQNIQQQQQVSCFQKKALSMMNNSSHEDQQQMNGALTSDPLLGGFQQGNSSFSGMQGNISIASEVHTPKAHFSSFDPTSSPASAAKNPPTTLNEVMEKLSDSMRRSAMSRSMVKQFSGRNLVHHSSKRNLLVKQCSARGQMTGQNQGLMIGGHHSCRNLMRQGSDRSLAGDASLRTAPVRRMSNGAKHHLQHQGRGLYRQDSQQSLNGHSNHGNSLQTGGRAGGMF